MASGSTLRYAFSTTGGDCLFSARFFDPKDLPHQICTLVKVPTRYQSQLTTVTGQFTIKRRGMVQLVWDNRGQWPRRATKLEGAANAELRTIPVVL